MPTLAAVPNSPIGVSTGSLAFVGVGLGVAVTGNIGALVSLTSINLKSSQQRLQLRDIIRNE